jgi:chromosome segregation ATPase/ubiquinone/menaquinone biosynthesis C-methylase UbiE
MSQPVPPEQPHANTWIERLVHYQYISELLTGRRVLELGCGSGRGAAFLASVARHVVAVDTSSIELSLSRRAYPRPNLEFVVGEPDRLQLDGASFDVVLVPELGRWVTRGAFMPELRRMLAPGGLAFFTVRSGDGDGHGGMAYHDLTEYLSQAFPQLRLIGVLPFHGQILAEFDPIDELEPQLDSSLVSEDEAPTHYLALCSDQPIPPLGYSVIQVPLGGTPIGELEGLREKFDRLVEERAEVELKLEEMRAQVADAERRVLEAGREARQELTSIRREVREKTDRLELRERELQQTRAALEEARSLQHEGERAVDDVVEELKLQMEEQRERAQLELQQARQRLEQHVEGSGRRIKQLEEELRDARAGQPAAPEADGAALSAARNRIEALELALKELREENLALERRTRAPDEGELVTLRPGEDEDTLTLTRRLDRERARAEALEERLARERERLDRERDRAEAAVQKQLEEHARLEALNLRAELAERTLAEVRGSLDRERQRAEGAERRCDNLVIRIEQGAGELSSLHGRLAELQGLHQADLWRIDELTGRLRELEARGGGVQGASSAELAAAQARIRELEQRAQGSAEAETHVAELEKRAAELAVQNKQYGDVVADLERKLMLADSRVVENARKATNAESKVVQLEVKLKRSEAEAATLSKWAEELRDELKEAQGKSTVRPVTPEPEVAALRNDLREAQARIAELEGRCDRYLKDSEATKALLKEREQSLEEALRSADGGLLDELRQLRARAVDIEGLRLELEQARDEADELANQLRDVEQADAELGRTRRELEELRQRVRDVDGAAEELEQLRLASVHQKETQRELERVRSELEAARIELARAEDEARGSGTLPEEAGWGSWSGEGEEEEEGEEEFERYVGAEMEGGELAEGEAEAGWEADERLRVRERQLEALLEGAALHREETERLQAQIAEMDALCEELQGERTALEGRFAEAERRLAEQRTTGQELRDELLRVGRELARAQGELRRCRDERDALAGRGGDAGSAGVERVQREDLEREVRARQRLEADLQTRLRELDEAQRQLRERDRAFDALRSEETAHRAELRDLRRQLEQRATGDGGRSAMERSLGELARARAQMAELEGKLRAEAEQLAGLEVQLRGLAAVVEKPT